jgi:TolB-like protein/class 3 adenylate cyclase/Tfp pilus assembly protein PilF
MIVTRRLAAILAADVAGYSRLMGADEGATLQGLKTIQTELIDPKIAAHNGRLVKTTGDGFLAEFSSVVDALRCAVEIQREMAERNAVVAPERRIEYRIGINVGDVVVENGDIFGDGVNVAARLEGLAEPGGICVSARVQEDAAGKLDLAFEDMGDQQLRNIVRPVRVHRVRIAESAATRASPTVSIPQPAVAPRLSIVVLPFTNLSNDPEQQYFADGITEDLTADLSRIQNMFVISRNTAFTYRNKPIGTKQIGRELGVRYVLEGSVRRSRNQVRVNAQLIDAENDAHLWAERFDGDITDLVVLQDEITSRIAVTLNFALVRAEAARPTQHPDAQDYIFQGRAAAWKPNSREKWAEVIGLFERALALDPSSVQAQSRLAMALAGRTLSEMADKAAVDLAHAERLVAQALAASPASPIAHFAKGEVLRAQGRPEEATLEYETAIASNRNFVYAIFALSMCKLLTGSIEEAIPAAERAIRLSPRDPNILGFYLQIGLAHLLLSRTDQAIVWLDKARNAHPVHPQPHAWLASAYALKGDTERAAAELIEARRMSVDDRYTTLTRLRAARYWGVPKIRALFEATYFAGLRKAGMPEG